MTNYRIILVMDKDVGQSYQQRLSEYIEKEEILKFSDHGYDVRTGSQYYVWLVDDLESSINDFIRKFIIFQPLDEFLYFTMVDNDIEYQVGLYIDNPFGLHGSI